MSEIFLSLNYLFLPNANSRIRAKASFSMIGFDVTPPNTLDAEPIDSLIGALVVDTFKLSNNVS